MTLGAVLTSCHCHECTTQATRERDARLANAAWEHRLRGVEAGLYRLTWGDDAERDEAGAALAELCADLLRAQDTNRARPWERRIVTDRRGRPLEAYETISAIRDVGATLGDCSRQARGPMVYLGTAALTQAIADTRQRMKDAMALPLERKIDVEVARRAGVALPRASDAERSGLVPASSPNVLDGTLAFPRRA